MNLTIKVICFVFLLSTFGLTKNKDAQPFSNKSLLKSDFLASGFYVLNDSLGTKRILQGTNEYYFIESKSKIPIHALEKVKISFVKNKIFGKVEKRFGLLFKLDPKGENEIKNMSKIALKKRAKIGLIIKNKLIIASYMGSEITNTPFFIETNTSKEDLKNLEKIIKKELKN
ncbi:hypothetical protein D1816_12645 [Aquimarina sp. AD10]|uniref:hypothetical protein n=1 Tax=Aquimarina sp. AD10 TaxID=1714849 RepID=UPI000E4D4B30|nr:hypothetical protein [Aquimarina sp. AD10]AXT61158.1 hypothetical protein D1816_12645 [Aquimarina sp. AD10]RKN02226.1 hypothetical protein D7033_01965 [Aquimarina sp. AD10]